MEVELKELTLSELLELYRAVMEFLEFLSVEENAEVESRKKQ